MLVRHAFASNLSRGREPTVISVQPFAMGCSVRHVLNKICSRFQAFRIGFWCFLFWDVPHIPASKMILIIFSFFTIVVDMVITPWLAIVLVITSVDIVKSLNEYSSYRYIVYDIVCDRGNVWYLMQKNIFVVPCSYLDNYFVSLVLNHISGLYWTIVADVDCRHGCTGP